MRTFELSTLVNMLLVSFRFRIVAMKTPQNAANFGIAIPGAESDSEPNTVVRQMSFAGRASSPLAGEEALKRADRFRRAHPLAEQRAFLLDTGNQLLWCRLQQLA